MSKWWDVNITPVRYTSKLLDLSVFSFSFLIIFKKHTSLNLFELRLKALKSKQCNRNINY